MTVAEMKAGVSFIGEAVKYMSDRLDGKADSEELILLNQVCDSVSEYRNYMQTKVDKAAVKELLEVAK
jgi:hypothetical protein